MGILKRGRLCIWAWRLPSDGIDEVLDTARECDEFYRALADYTPVQPSVTTHRVMVNEIRIREFPPIDPCE